MSELKYVRVFAGLTVRATSRTLKSSSVQGLLE
jgi:hypothetical protein